MFYWEDYKSSGFDRSNLFLLRIANPQGRLAVDFLESPGVVFRQAFRRICNPASKNVRPYYFADLQSAYLIVYYIARIILFFPKASSLVSISLKPNPSSISLVSFS